jgi:hypothetical protein
MVMRHDTSACLYVPRGGRPCWKPAQSWHADKPSALSLYASLLALQAQHASSEHDKIIISALNIQDDKPEEKEEQPLPSLFDSRIPQLPEEGTDIEIEPEASPPIQRMTCSKSSISAFVIPEVLRRSQSTNWDLRGASPGLQPLTNLLYGPRRQALRVLPRLLRNAEDEQVRRQTKNPVGRL